MSQRSKLPQWVDDFILERRRKGISLEQLRGELARKGVAVSHGTVHARAAKLTGKAAPQSASKAPAKPSSVYRPPLATRRVPAPVTSPPSAAPTADDDGDEWPAPGPVADALAFEDDAVGAFVAAVGSEATLEHWLREPAKIATLVFGAADDAAHVRPRPDAMTDDELARVVAAERADTLDAAAAALEAAARLLRDRQRALAAVR